MSTAATSIFSMGIPPQMDFEIFEINATGREGYCTTVRITNNGTSRLQARIVSRVKARFRGGV